MSLHPRAMKVVLCFLAVLLVAPATSPAASSPIAQIKHLRRALAHEKAAHRAVSVKYVDALAALGSTRNDAANLRVTVTSLNAQVMSLMAQLATRTQERDALAAENAGLKGDVPSKVAAIAKTGNTFDLESLVLNPAHSNWACGGSVFFGQTFFSYDFDRRASDGSCY